MVDTASARRKLPGPEYVTRVVFDAPLEFAFRWCTDYGPGDPGLEGGGYYRQVIERSRNRVIYEDLQPNRRGWEWARYEVTLLPPAGWDMDSIGTQRHAVGDYRLTRRPDGRTAFELRYRREPSLRPFRRVPKSERDPEDHATWRGFGRALERDYRASRRSRRGRR